MRCRALAPEHGRVEELAPRDARVEEDASLAPMDEDMAEEGMAEDEASVDTKERVMLS